MHTSKNIFDRIAFYLILGVLFLTPVFFVPSASVAFNVGKSALIILLSAVAFFLWLIARLKDGSYLLPKSWLYASSFLLFAVYGLATLFSPNIHVSFFGQGLSIGSFAFIASVLVLSLLIPQLVTSEKKIFYLYTAFFAAFAVVVVYEVIKLVHGGLAFGILTSNTSNLVGGWNDLGIFAGLIAILSMIALDTLQLSRILKPFLYFCLVFSAFFVALAGFAELWIILGLVSLSFFVYQLSFKKSVRTEGRNIAFHSLIILLVSIVFIFGGASINNSLGKIFNVTQIEVRPSWSATDTIIHASVSEHPVLGAGPERFSYEWLLHKPAGVNSTIFWNTNFNYGVGFIPSLVVTIGILGVLAFLIYLVLLLLSAARAFVVVSKTDLGGYFLISSISGVVYLWVLACVYVSGPAIIAITFAFSGLLIATLLSQGAITSIEISVIGKPVRSFLSVLITVLLLIAIVAFGYSVSKNIIASAYFGRAVTAAGNGSTDLAISDLQTALSIAPDASYDRALADIYLSQINNLINTSQPDQADAVKQLQTLLASAIGVTQGGTQGPGSSVTNLPGAITLDPADPANYLELGKVYASVVPLKVSGAYGAAKAAYAKASALSPQDPEIDLAVAQLELANGSTTAAQTAIESALGKKNDYADAIFLLSQIEISQGDVPDAINSVKAVAVLSPTDPGVFFQLGLLEYSQKDYQDAAQALAKAVALSPQYANAEYFLGLSDYYNGDATDAITQFENLAKTNGNNTIVTSILANLQAGRDPFAGQKTTAPKTLPVVQ